MFKDKANARGFRLSRATLKLFAVVLAALATCATFSPLRAGGDKSTPLPKPRVTVNFTAVDGTTAINRTFVGQVTRVTFVNLARTKLPKGAVKAKVDQTQDAIRVILQDARDIGGIVVEGSAGSVGIFVKQAAPAALLSSQSIVPSQGAIMIGNGSANDTLMTAPHLVDPGTAPAANSVSIAGSSALTVAMRADSIAIRGSNLTPPTSGHERVSIKNAAGGTTESIVHVWGYNVSVQPVTAVGESVPIMLQVTGLRPDEVANFQFIPQPGQQISPQSVDIHGSQANSPTPVSQLSSNRPGPQAFDVAASLNSPP